ncbi:hypothetical protein RchiOBHm_Chr4g0441161 [Rosa chinensis]|uniref:Uncharacterized protein n=1 Tax=Rosa chinensis TaxID=74649 RepID=A0A2P6R3A9_ROSCH|nr:hypothetical protein RchiOBHm_Chr4g0441161 [Rosa chinensis]
MICSHIPRFSLPWCSIPQVHQRGSNSFAAVTCPRSCTWDSFQNKDISNLSMNRSTIASLPRNPSCNVPVFPSN